MKALLVLICAGVVATPAAAQSWQAFARSNSRAYLMDVANLAKTDDISTARIAMVARQAPAGDYSHSVETYEIQCAQERWRTAGMIEYGPDGSEAGNYPEADAQWEAARPGTLAESIKILVCDGQRVQDQDYPSIQAYIDSGRP